MKISETYKINVEQNQGVAKITGEIPADVIAKNREKAIDGIVAFAEIDGFRKGHAPRDVVIKKYGEVKLITESADIAMREVYPEIIAESKLQVITQPSVTLTKVAPNNPVGFTIEVTLIPEVTLADYKKIGKEIVAKQEPVFVTDEEVTESEKEMKRHIALNMTDKKDSDVKKEDIKDEDLPEITDEQAKALLGVNKASEVKGKIKEEITKNKERQAKEKLRLESAEAIFEKSEFVIAPAIVASELDVMMSQFEQDVSRTGLTLDDYLKKVGKTRADLRSEWKDDALKRVKLQLTLGKIGQLEKMTPDPEELQKNMEIIEKNYGSDANFDSNRARAYIENQLINEQVFTFLENLK